MTDRRRVRAIIRGRVQGVGYRDWAQGRARLHGLDGWVRNRGDGSVEALLAGPQDAVRRMLDDLRLGPPLAEVTAVEEAEAGNEADERAGFHARYTV